MVEQEQEIKPQSKVNFRKFEHKGWEFYDSVHPMFTTKELDIVSDACGTMGMPEVFYGYNHLMITNPGKDFLLEFSSIEALRLSAFKYQKKFYKKRSSEGEDKEGALTAELENKLILDPEVNLNLIDIIPRLIEVKEAQLWKHKDTSKVKDFKQIEVISDWTYSTTYKGGVKYLSNHAERIKNETSLDLKVDQEAKSKQVGKLKVEPTQDQIPIERLGRENPIIHFGEVFLFEDDLGDQGYTQCYIRFRVMDDCFYILLRYYLRVDEVTVRIYDTRIFKGFESDFSIREFQHKESSYDELRNKGFQISSQWSLSKTQSDEVAGSLDLKLKYLDKILI